MTLKRLYLSEFTAYQELDLAFSPGINVLIGENGAGKTHAIKAAYAVLRAAQAQVTSDAGEWAAAADALRLGLVQVFKPDNRALSRLVRRPGGADRRTEVEVEAALGAVRFAINAADGALQVREFHFDEAPRSLFIPTHDMLAAYEGFFANYQKYQTSFERTYADYCEALGGELLREEVTAGWTPPQRAALLASLHKLIGGAPKLVDNRFYLELDGILLEAHLAAEGLRKVAGLYQLIANGALQPGTVLFWDEPETNLNPRISARLAPILKALADSGVQIFLTTHDFLLSRKLSRQGGQTRFFSFRGDRKIGQVVVESGDDLADIDHNPIVAEYSRAYDDELEEG